MAPNWTISKLDGRKSHVVSSVGFLLLLAPLCFGLSAPAPAPANAPAKAAATGTAEVAECDDNYKKCIADVINNPEPRTYVEQQTLDACQQTYGDCQHSCENSNKPQENQQEQKEGN